MTKQELAKRILTLILPWPLSRLMPSSIRSTFTLSPGTGATPYIGSGAPAPTPGAGATAETIFMPSPIAPQGILSGVIAWPSNTSPMQGPPSAVPPSPISGADQTDVLNSTYWTDAADQDSATFDDEAGTIQADADFNLYPTDTIDDATEIDGITLEFTDSETIGTIDIIQQNVDEPDAVNIVVDDCASPFSWNRHENNTRWGQTFIDFPNKTKIDKITFRLSRGGGNVALNTYTLELWTVLKVPVSQQLQLLKRTGTVITGDNDWSETWVEFSFSPAAILPPDITYAFLLRCDLPQSTNYVAPCVDDADTIEGSHLMFTAAGAEHSGNATVDANIKIHAITLPEDVVIATFPNVPSGQTLPFPMCSLKNMYMRFKDPSNPAAGVIITSLIAQTYGFSTG